MKWLDFLENYVKEDVTKTKKILSDEATKLTEAVNKAFSGHPYVTKREAKLVVERELVSDAWIAEHKDVVLGKIESLTEGEIRIIINNDVSKGSGGSSSMPVVMSGEPVGASTIEFEGATKRGRGRPSKKATEAAIKADEIEEEEDIEECDTKKPIEEEEENLVKWTKVVTDKKGVKRTDVTHSATKPEGEGWVSGGKSDGGVLGRVVKEEDSKNSELSWAEIEGKIDSDEDGKKEVTKDVGDGTTAAEYKKDDGLDDTEEDVKEESATPVAKKDAISDYLKSVSGSKNVA